MALLRSGDARLNDAANPSLSLESRFDLTYNAAHALALAALRRLGYRSWSRTPLWHHEADDDVGPLRAGQLLAQVAAQRSAEAGVDDDAQVATSGLRQRAPSRRSRFAGHRQAGSEP